MCYDISSKKEKFKYASAPFQTDIKFIFEGFDVDIKNCTGFEKSTRSLLVHNILQKMIFDESNEDCNIGDNVLISLLESVISKQTYAGSEYDRKRSLIIDKKLKLQNLLQYNDDNYFNNELRYTALPYMLKNKYFNDSFILHEQSSQHSNAFNDIIFHMIKNQPDFSKYALVLFQSLKEPKKIEKTIFLDTRKDLDDNWARIKNIFRTQV